MDSESQINSTNNNIQHREIRQKNDKLKRNSITGPLFTAFTAGIIGISGLYYTTNAQQITTQQTGKDETEKIYNVQNIPAENLKFKLSPLEFSNVKDAGNNLYEIVDWLKERENKDIYLIDNIDNKTDDYLIETDENNNVISRLPIRYQSFTNAISGIRHIPNKANSWDRLEITDFEKINDIDYVKLFQNPGDKTSWLSTRWDQIFNYLKLMPGIPADEAIMKDIIKLNVNREYNVDLDTAKMIVIPRIDPKNGQLSIEDIIYTSNETSKGKISGYVVARRDAPHYEFKKGHILIQQDRFVELPLSVIPKDIVQVQDFLSREPRGITKKSENIPQNQPYIEPVTTPKKNSEVSSIKLSLSGTAGYGDQIWHETDNFTDFNMDNRGLLLQGEASLEHITGAFIQIKGKYFSPNETGYVDNKINKKVGLFTNHEVNVEAIAGFFLGNDNFKLFLGPKYVFEKEHPTVAFDLGAGSHVFVESNINRNIIGLVTGVGVKSGIFNAYIFGNYGVGNENKTDLGINDNNVEVSKSDIESICAGANIGIGPVELLTKWDVRNYFAKQGFTQNRKENIINFEGKWKFLDNVFLEAGYDGRNIKIKDRNFNADRNKIYVGIGLRLSTGAGW